METRCMDGEWRNVVSNMDDAQLSRLVREAGELLRLRKGLEVPSCRKSAQEPRPCRMFFVPDGVRHLSSEELTTLEQSFEAWVDLARTEAVRASRRRVRIIFLMLRHSGAKVGEVLALDETRDIDFVRSLASFGGGNHEEDASYAAAGVAAGTAEHECAGSRSVPLPKAFLEELSQYMNSPAAMGFRHTLFHMDQGFLRRKFYEQAERVPFAKALLNPTVLRHSRAIELLRAGVPLPVVQAMLGHSSVVLTAGYYAFSEQDSRRILAHHIHKGASVKTSARNSFRGTVSHVRTGEILTEVVLRTNSGQDIVAVITGGSSVNLDIALGRSYTAIIKAPFVLLAKEEGRTLLSARNRFLGTVRSVRADGVSVEVTGELADGTVLCSLITEASVATLDLKQGDSVWFFFKAMSVILVAD